jgi:hypothetical protein
MAQTAQILSFPRYHLAQVQPQLDDSEIGLALALSICTRHGLTFDQFYRAHPGAVQVADATVNRDALACWIGIAA